MIKPVAAPVTALLALAMLAAWAHALSWSEIHFNPLGNDNGKEFIELTGTEDLGGCTVSDSASSDTLALVKREGTGIILIVEADGVYNGTPDATIYHAGLAIGNSLGNTGDTISIACNNSILLSTAYNTSMIMGHEEGVSIEYHDGWTLGTGNGTPGIASVPRALEPNPPPEPASERCNDTLLLSLHAASGRTGDSVSFDLISAGYAWYEATENGTAFAYGDTLEEEHSIILPDTAVKLTAYARHCGGRQRMTRTITVMPAEPMVMPATIPSPQLAVPEQAQAEVRAPIITAAAVQPSHSRAIIDQDRDAVPWISAFGIVTIITSAAVFLLRREE